MTGAFDDVELDELTRDITAKWLAEAPPRTAFDQNDLAIASKLMSRSEVARLSELKPGERFVPLRPRRSVATRATTLVRYFCVPAAEGVYTSYAGWTIEVSEGKRKRTLFHSLSDAKAAFCISELQKRHHRVEMVVTDTMKRAGIIRAPAPGIRNEERPIEPHLHVARTSPSRQPQRPPAKPRQERSKRFDMMEQLKGFKR